jgi:hypothetical protein
MSLAPLDPLLPSCRASLQNRLQSRRTARFCLRTAGPSPAHRPDSMRNARLADVGCCALAFATLAASFPAEAANELGIPPECGSRQTFDAALQKRLGDDVPHDTVHISITAAPSGFHLRVQIDGELRELDDESCAELFRAAIVVAVAMLMHEPTPPETVSQPAQAPAKAPSSSPSRPRFTLAAGAGVTVGILPPPVFAVDLESKALWRYWGVGLGLRYLAPGEQRDAAGRGVRLQAWGAGLTGIFRPSRSWEARLGFATQRLFGEGLLSEGAPTFQGQEDTAWAAGPTLGLAFIPLERPPFWVGLGAEGQLSLLRAHFRILKVSRNIYDVPWLSGSGFVRLGLAW